MYKKRIQELSNNIREILTEEEKQLLFEACMGFGNELVSINQKLSMISNLHDEVANKAADYFDMARIISNSMKK